MVCEIYSWNAAKKPSEPRVASSRKHLTLEVGDMMRSDGGESTKELVAFCAEPSLSEVAFWMEFENGESDISIARDRREWKLFALACNSAQ